MEPLARGGDLGSRRRRAIHAGLSGQLQPEQLMQALWIWEDEFAEGSPYGFSKYVGRVREVLGLGPEYQQGLEGSLIDKLHVPAEELGPDPFESMLAHRGQAGSPAAADRGGSTPGGWTAPEAAAPAARGPVPAAPQFVVLQRVLDSLLERVGRNAPDVVADLEVGLSKHLAELQLSAGALRLVADWSADRQRNRIFSGLTVEECSQLVSAVYIWCCEALGPVATDGHLKAAMREAEALPEAAEFSPRKLL